MALRFRFGFREGLLRKSCKIIRSLVEVRKFVFQLLKHSDHIPFRNMITDNSNHGYYRLGTWLFTF